MKIQLKGTNLEINDTIRNYAEKKLEGLKKVLSQFDDMTILAEVEVEKTVPDQHSGDIYRAEINLSVPGDLFRAEAEEADLYAAIDMVQEKMFREIRSEKNKKETLWRRAGAKFKRLIRRNPDQEGQ